ncbi:hypothetical protein [Gloeobacter violaceus]|nr:hypothetical protein [Gloeobacter violaceus]
MPTDEEKREIVTEKRHQQENLEHNMLVRAEEAEPEPITEEARELLTEQRRHEENLQHNMLHRAEEQLKS